MTGWRDAVAAARAAVRTQLWLQERYAARWEVSGIEALAASRVLRWEGDHLVGFELPDPPA